MIRFTKIKDRTETIGLAAKTAVALGAVGLAAAGTASYALDAGHPAHPAGLGPAKGKVSSPETARAAAPKPNILFILCDDLGYGDLSCFGQKRFQTPNIDRLAAEGTRLTQHYCASPVCGPSRTSLMLGLHAGDSPVRDQQFDRPIPETLTVASILKQAGYRTLSVGKWGLGGKPAGGFPAHPQKRGFDSWYGLYTHAAGHVHYPDTAHPLFDGYKNVTADVKDCYSTDLYTAKAKAWMIDQARTRPGQPFFMYLAYIAPHEAFDIPDGQYPPGGGLHGGVQWPLVTHPEHKNAWIYPEYRDATYEKDAKAPPVPWTWQMQHYATMIRRIDDAVGDLVQTLHDLKIDKNTLIVLTSDNGPAYDDGLHSPEFESWGPLDGFKRDVFEGGFREPTIAWWPGTIAAGVVSSRPSAQYDWMPTFCDLSGVVAPAESDGFSLAPSLVADGRFGPDRGVHPYFYWEFRGQSNRREDHDVLQRHGYTIPAEFKKLGPGDPWGQQQAVRVGDFVGVRAQVADPDAPLHLYDLAHDVHEDHDLAADPSRATVLARMRTLLVSARRPQPGNPRPYDSVPLPAVAGSAKAQPGLRRRTYLGEWPWAPDVRTLMPDTEADSAVLDIAAALQGKPGAVEFTGYLNVPATGEYRLMLEGGDRAAHLWVDESHVLTTEADAAAPDRSDSVTLEAGRHAIRILLVDDGKGRAPSARLLWSAPSAAVNGVPVPVPASALTH